jgi:FkbM family methyltransferase
MYKEITKKYSKKEYRHKILKNLTLRMIIRLKKNNKKERLQNLIVYSGDLIGQEIVVNGLLEAIELETLILWLKHNNLVNGAVLDIGANIGNHSVFFSRYFNKVFCYEPHPLTFRILELNSLKYPNITCFNYGVSDKIGEASIYVSGDFYGSARLDSMGNESYLKEEEKIKLITIDNQELLNLEKIGLIKIDVEGHEINVLKGAKNLIKREKPVIIFEQHSREFKDGSTQVIEFLKSLDYINFYLIKENSNIPNWIPKPLNQILELFLKIFIGYNFRVKEANNIKPGFYSSIIAVPDK